MWMGNAIAVMNRGEHRYEPGGYVPLLWTRRLMPRYGRGLSPHCEPGGSRPGYEIRRLYPVMNTAVHAPVMNAGCRPVVNTDCRTNPVDRTKPGVKNPGLQTW